MKKNGGGGPLVTKLCPRLMTPWTVDRQAPLSLRFPRQEYWSGLPFPSPGDLPGPEIELRFPALQADIYTYVSIYILSHTHTHTYAYICKWKRNPHKMYIKSEPLCKLWPLLNNNLSILAHQLSQMDHTNTQY